MQHAVAKQFPTQYIPISTNILRRIDLTFAFLNVRSLFKRNRFNSVKAVSDVMGLDILYGVKMPPISNLGENDSID